MVDRDLQAIYDFCVGFEGAYLNPMQEKAGTLMGIANEINDTLGNTQFATKSQEGVYQMAKSIQSAVSEGEARIKELQRRVSDQMERGREFTR